MCDWGTCVPVCLVRPSRVPRPVPVPHRQNDWRVAGGIMEPNQAKVNLGELSGRAIQNVCRSIRQHFGYMGQRLSPGRSCLPHNSVRQLGERGVKTDG